jgi:hypothetical protein
MRFFIYTSATERVMINEPAEVKTIEADSIEDAADLFIDGDFEPDDVDCSDHMAIIRFDGAVYVVCEEGYAPSSIIFD